MTTSSGCQVELHLPSRPEFMLVARMMVSAVASRLLFDVEAIEDIKAAVGEACNNAIEHGCAGEPGSGMIVLRCDISDDALTICIEDDGKGFDPMTAVRKYPDAAVELTERGMGMLLIEALMDEVEYISAPGDGTRVRMVKHRGALEER